MEYEDVKPVVPEPDKTMPILTIAKKSPIGTNVIQLVDKCKLTLDDTKPFTCAIYSEETRSICGKNFALERQLDTHYHWIHGGVRYEPFYGCRRCQLHFENMMSFHWHIRQYHGRPKSYP